ncbi:hypothetical protein [Nocardiopsis sp. LOL_012]|uniref:hypothetical protein n=1 Tax=Nocardiopsis sp. LOL_012 TaxID=3345409 RepID=UPI003A8966D2
MPRTPKQPNTQLAELLNETHMPAKGLARRVVAHGHERGLVLAYDHNSVRRWLEGERPQQPVPALIAEVLAEALGRPVNPADCGLPGHEDFSPEFPLDWTSGIHTAAQLYRDDAERRRTLTGGYSSAAYPSAATRWLTHPPGLEPIHRGRARVGRPEIDAIRQMTRAFYDLDNRVGGGRIRSTVVQYLNSNVAPLLRGTYTSEIGRELFSAAAELTKAVGWMAYDCEEHGLAQRYLVQALRMAQTAGEHGLCAEILAAMGHQATYIGRSGEAVDLARAAQSAAARSGHPALVAECHLIEAHGHAGRSDTRATSGALRAGEKAFEKDDPAPPEWLAYFDSAYLAAKVAHCFLALGVDAQTARYAERSLEMNEGYVRGRVFNLLMLATAHAPNEPEEAVRVGGVALGLVEGLQSRRAFSYLRRLQHRLSRHEHHPDVAEFNARAAVLTAG